jgi:hypothetical protein
MKGRYVALDGGGAAAEQQRERGNGCEYGAFHYNSPVNRFFPNSVYVTHYPFTKDLQNVTAHGKRKHGIDRDARPAVLVK